jgi:hypothetical protein
LKNKLGNKKQNELSEAKMFTEAVVVSKETGINIAKIVNRCFEKKHKPLTST